MTSLSIPFDSASLHTYDSNLIEVTGSKAQLKDQRPSGAIFGANYAAAISPNFANATITSTASGGAAVLSGKLDLAHADLRYVKYEGIDLSAVKQIGCIRFRVTPNYTGSPAGPQVFAMFNGAFGILTNNITLYHHSDGGFYCYITNSAAAVIVAGSIGAWSPVSGTEYEVEFNYDFTSGATRLFINGTQLGSTLTQTGTRDYTSLNLFIGTNYQGVFTANFKIDDIIIFDSVQHTANYTAGYSVPSNIYVTTSPSISLATNISSSGLSEFIETESITGSDVIRYTILADGVEKYWDGTAWENSSGYAQSNSASEINDNADTLTILETLNMKIYLSSNDGSTTPRILDIVILYDVYVAADEPTLVTVYGYIFNSDGERVQGATVTASYDRCNFIYNRELLVMNEIQKATSNNLGYWKLRLYDTVNSNAKVNFTIVADGTSYTYPSLTIPKADTVRFEELAA